MFWRVAFSNRPNKAEDKRLIPLEKPIDDVPLPAQANQFRRYATKDQFAPSAPNLPFLPREGRFRPTEHVA